MTCSSVQTGLASNCDKFYDVESGDGCANIASSYGIALTDFYDWNPAVSSCTDLYPSYYVCVGTTAVATTTTAGKSSTATNTGIVTPAPIQSGMVSDCDKFYDVESGDGCYNIAASYGIALTDFYDWNPAISSCTDLFPSYYVCVGTAAAAATTTEKTTSAGTPTQTGIITPTPTQGGMVTDCAKFYDVESGDGCYNIAASYGIALTDFYNWNPAVSSCTDLWPSYYVCVGLETAGAAKRTAAAPAITTAA